MKRSQRLTVFCLLIIALTTIRCTEQQGNGFEITVTWKNADKWLPVNTESGVYDSTIVARTPHIILEELPSAGDKTPVILDSADLNGKTGKIVLNGNGKEEGIYQVMIENGPAFLIVNDVSSMNIEIDLAKNDMDFYTSSGSEGTGQLKAFFKKYEVLSGVVNDVFLEIDSLKQLGGTDSLLIAATNRKNQAISAVNDYLADFIQKSNSPAVSLFALGISSRSFQKTEFEATLNRVVAKFPEHAAIAQLKLNYSKQEAQLADQNSRKPNNFWLGKEVPEFSMPDMNGKSISVASFRGRYVLIDFWASWCGPCRAENPNLVKVYNEFKDKNFAILGVSLDKSKDEWIKAVKDDKLIWTQISDLAYWNSKSVELFKFDGIPYNVLVDPQGKIVAERLRGDELGAKLREILQ